MPQDGNCCTSEKYNQNNFGEEIHSIISNCVSRRVVFKNPGVSSYQSIVAVPEAQK
jgi:hypothetical protein